MKARTLLFLTCIVAVSACNSDRTSKSRGPIVLGDSSTIVTETDEQLLQDQVPDLKPAIEQESAVSTPTADTASTVQAAPAAPAAAVPPGNGLTVAFKEVSLFIPNITTRNYNRGDLKNARGASYEITGGNVVGNTIRATSGSIQKVTQRYETILVLKDGGNVLPLESLGKYASGWEPLTGNNGVFAFRGLEAARLEYKQISPSTLRNAVQQAARRQRLNRQDTQDWLDAVRNVRSANQAPAATVLRSVSWRVEGKDATGKNFNKEVRIDVPVK
jgi:hypothetical protein